MEGSGLKLPKLRHSVGVEIEQDRAFVTGATGTHTLFFPSDGQVALGRLFDDLRAGGIACEELERRHPDIDGLPDLIGQLDGLHLLTESEFAVPEGTISGAQLDRVVHRMARRQQQKLASSRFQALLVDDSATHRQLVGYALEYFWLVRAAPALIAPAIATAADLRLRARLQEFLASELNHDRYLLSALKAAGIVGDLTALQPLPTTFRICASLGAYAQQHPLSFLAALFLFEQAQPAFIEAFERRCIAIGLPKAFYAPLRQHSTINDEADHGAISTELLSLVPAVILEEQVVVKRNMAVLVETMVQQESEILDYYGDPDRPFPRLFS